MSTQRTGRLMAMAFTITMFALSGTLVSPLDASAKEKSSKKSEKSGKSRKHDGGPPATTPITAFNVQASDNVLVDESFFDASGNLIRLQTFRVFVSVSDPTTGDPITSVAQVVTNQPMSRQACGFPTPPGTADPGLFLPLDLDTDFQNLGDGLYSVALRPSQGCVANGQVVAQIVFRDGIRQGNIVPVGTVIGPFCLNLQTGSPCQ